MNIVKELKDTLAFIDTNADDDMKFKEPNDALTALIALDFIVSELDKLISRIEKANDQ